MKAGNTSSAEELPRRILKLIPTPALIATRDGTIVEANPALLELTEKAKADLCGKPLADLVEEPPDRIARYLDLCFGGTDAVPGRLTWRSAEGPGIPVRCDGGLLTIGPAEKRAVLITCRDPEDTTRRFTLLTRQIDALSREVIHRKKTQEDLENALRVRDEFISTASHELRNPLNALNLSLHALSLTLARGGQLSREDLLARVARSSSQVDRLSTLMNFLLDVSRL